MARIYISSHDKDAAADLATRLVEEGHAIVSTWHDEPGGKVPLDKVAVWELKPWKNLDQIDTANVLVLIAGPDKYTGGKFVEAGYAVKQDNTRVVVLGKPENGMLVGVAHQVDTVDDLLSFLDIVDSE